jgi:hypothetical protein
MQSLLVPASFRTLPQQQRPGVRLLGPIFCGVAPSQSERREKKRQDHAGVRLGHIFRLLYTTGKHAQIIN